MNAKIYFAADHAGYELKNDLLAFVRDSLKMDVDDCGAYTHDPHDDYPQFMAIAAKKLSNDVAEGKESRAVLVGGSGQGEAILANKFKGVRCAVYYGGEREQVDSTNKQMGIVSASRLHDNTNALALGSRTLSTEEACDSLKTWLNTPFLSEERHLRRLAAVDALL